MAQVLGKKNSTIFKHF